LGNGYITINDKPGLGIEVNEDFLNDQLYDGSWRNPVLYHVDDGTICDW